MSHAFRGRLRPMMLAARAAWRLVGVATLLLLAVVGAETASAATVRAEADVYDYEGMQLPGWNLVFNAGGGETNRLEITVADTGVARVVDAGAPLSPSEGCAQVAPNEVACSRANAPLLSVSVDLGDGDDETIRLDGSVAFRVVGGEGDDLLRGPPDKGVTGGFLFGGPGRDHLIGGSWMEGGLGDDRLEGQAGALKGQAGESIASYQDARTPVRVDLSDAGADGRAGEADILVGITRVSGGSADDVLIGDARKNFLEGNDGDDILSGGANDDVLSDGAGVDRVDGGTGNDLLSGSGAAPGARGGDRLTCGAGTRDTVSEPEPTDELSGDCERYQSRSWLGGLSPAVVAVRRYSVRFNIRCPRLDPGGAACRGGIELRDASGAHRLLGRGAIRARRGQLVSVLVELSAAGRAVLRRGGRARVTILRILSVRGGKPDRSRAAYTLRLSMPRRSQHP